MGVGSGGAGVRGLPWIFIHDTGKVKEESMVLFFGLSILFFPLPPSLENFLPTLLAVTMVTKARKFTVGRAGKS